MAGPATPEEYDAAQPDWARDALARLRATIREVIPDATETISYGMPTFRDTGGRMVVSIAAFRDHCSLFPLNGHLLATLGAEAEPYAAGKGTMRMRRGEPLPEELVRKIVRLRLEENAAKKSR